MATVRDATEADVEAVARVHVQAWRESYAEFLSEDALKGLSVGERAAMWQRAFERPEPAARFLVAEAARGEVVGFARGGSVRSGGPVSLETESEIYAIYLLDKAKRRGIGRRLLLGVFDHLAMHGFRSCGLWVLTGNAAAGRFYESLGGVPGPQRTLSLPSQTLTEIAYRFEPIPRASSSSL